ncbi:MAG: hypothetical protein GX352_01255 [Clostridiales bacterium]|nr:hypothetical protein [Clostridiales bacterium]
MTKDQKKYIAIQAVMSFFINGVINGLIAYFLNLNSHLEQVSMQQNYIDLVFDILITSLILAWLIAWSINSGLKKDNYYGVKEPKTKLSRWMGHWFKKPARYGWLLCIGMIPLIYGLSALGIYLFGFTHFTLWGYTIYKSVYTAFMGAVFSVIFIISGFYVDTSADNTMLSI